MSVLQLHRPSQIDIAQQIGRLCAAFGRPFKANAQAMTEEWHRSLAPRFACDVIAAAVDRCCDNDTKFPTLARLRAFCFRIEAERKPEKAKGLKEQHAEWEPSPWEAPCPVCGSEVEHTKRGDLMVHDDKRHTEARISYSNFGNPEWRHLPRLEDPKPAPSSRRLPSNPAAKPATALADVVKAEVPKIGAKAEIQRVLDKQPARNLWEDVPLPAPPPDAVMAH